MQLCRLVFVAGEADVIHSACASLQTGRASAETRTWSLRTPGRNGDCRRHKEVPIFGDAVLSGVIFYFCWRYAFGDMPVSLLKYFPKNDWLGKFSV